MLTTAEPDRDGVGIIILLDSSGSMGDPVPTVAHQKEAKYKIARQSILGVIRTAEEFVQAHPKMDVRLGVYEFSDRHHRQNFQKVIGIGKPHAANAAGLLMAISPEGGTPIGSSMIQARQFLGKTGLKHQHILVVTDGENTSGYLPGDVMQAMSQLAPGLQASVYFIAFDTNADKFSAMRRAGGLVLSANNDDELRQTMDFIMTGKILIEQPLAPKQ